MIAVLRPRKPRALDWACGVFALVFGMVLLAPGQSVPWSPDEGLLHSLPEEVWAVLFVAAGLGRVVALIVNGRMPSGSPAIRAVSALVAGYMWSQFVVAAAETSLAVHVVLPTFAFSTFFVFSEVYLCVRAAHEFITARQLDGHPR